MKIIGIECLPVYSGWRKNFGCGVETDAGIIGWGEAYSHMPATAPSPRRSKSWAVI